MLVRHPWYSSYGSDFNDDFHVILNPAVAPAEYNYQDQAVPDQVEWPVEAPG